MDSSDEEMCAPFIHPNPDTFNSPGYQNFSLPSTLIHYISKNPYSAVGYLKLQKTCKYFFARNKIVIVDEAIFQGIHNGWYYNSSNDDEEDEDDEKPIYLKSIKNEKYWLIQSFGNDGMGDNETSCLFNPLPINIPNYIYRCDLVVLTILEKNLTLKEANFLLNGGKLINLRFRYSNIYDINGSIVSLDRILKKTPKLQVLEYSCENEIFTNETFEKMCALKFDTKCFEYYNIRICKLALDADITLLCKFVKGNCEFLSEHSKFYFYFGTNNSAKLKLQAAIVDLQVAVKEIEKSLNARVMIS